MTTRDFQGTVYVHVTIRSLLLRIRQPINPASPESNNSVAPGPGTAVSENKTARHCVH